MGRLGDANIGLTAAGVAFYSMLAVFPGISAVIAIWTAFADPAGIQAYLAVADDFIPPEAYQILNEQIQMWLSQPDTSIGFGTVVSLAFTLFSARAGVGALVLGLNVIHGTKTRNTIWSILFAYFMTCSLVGVMLTALATIVIVPVVVNFLPFHAVTDLMLSGLPWVAMLLLMLSALGILYRYGPNTKTETREPFFTYGALVAALAWGVVSLGLTFYLSNFANYSAVYGSIGAVIALLMWLYLSALAVLLGAAFNAQLAEHRAQSNSANTTK
ncbi:hypothetical protein BFP70_12240 [Thioclava sp. SK-1]|nr:hypothetical protein BFP70_12240 [Thioclava sp. SK-1]